jgi:myosin light chain 6
LNLKNFLPNLTEIMSVNADEVKKICAIYDWDAKGEIDMYYFMDIFYALGMNIIKKVTVKYGQTDDTGKKFCKYDEVVKLMQEAVKEPDSTGNYHDYVELCKLYDKNENGTIMLAELENILSNLGDEIPKEDTQKMLEELAPKEDEDGFIPYHPFLDKLCGKA